MNKEEITRKSIFMTGFRSKLTYPFSLEDLEEVEAIIDYYEQKVNQLETNRDNAIEILNFRSHSNDIELNMLHNLRMMNKAIEILKGSDE